jgi:hypothetical protein
MRTLPLNELLKLVEPIEVFFDEQDVTTDERSPDLTLESIWSELFDIMTDDPDQQTTGNALAVYKYWIGADEGHFPADLAITQSQIMAGMIITVGKLQAAGLHRGKDITAHVVAGAFRAASLREQEIASSRKRSAAKQGIARWREPVKLFVVEQFEGKGGSWTANRIAKTIAPQVLEIAKSHGRVLSEYSVEDTIRRMVADYKRTK